MGVPESHNFLHLQGRWSFDDTAHLLPRNVRRRYAHQCGKFSIVFTPTISSPIIFNPATLCCKAGFIWKWPVYPAKALLQGLPGQRQNNHAVYKNQENQWKQREDIPGHPVECRWRINPSVPIKTCIIDALMMLQDRLDDQIGEINRSRNFIGQQWIFYLREHFGEQPSFMSSFYELDALIR